MIATKTCTLCGRELPATAEFFHAQRLGRDGLASRCKDCRRELRRARVAANPAAEHARQREYAERTKDKRREYARRYRTRHLEELRARDREAGKRAGICEQCGRHYRGHGRRYCSTECGHLASRRRITFACKNCQKTVSVPASYAKFGNPAYCSHACWYADAHAQQLWGKIKPKVVVVCETCGKPILVNPAGADRKRFCSQACMLKWRGPVLSDLRREDHKRREHVCKWCGETFRRLDSQTKDGRGQFCSRQCLGAYTVKYKRQVVSLMEQRFTEALSAAGMVFETQARAGRFVLDVLFPVELVAVEFDGDYWHSLPEVAAKDVRKDAFLVGAGYKVVHVREMDFVADPDSTVRAVFDAITNE